MAGTGSLITQMFTYTPEFSLLATATDACGQTTTFIYDAFNRRRDRTINGSHNDFIYDGL
ncbi:MAG: hypothetical protein KIT73_16205 [Burkholderiales bacterium]|nr:hypothetical protein [Burkholderiales bacterium]